MPIKYCILYHIAGELSSLIGQKVLTNNISYDSCVAVQ